MALRSTSGYHIYEFDGVHYPSVTTILARTEDPDSKRGIENWKRNFYMPGFSGPDDYVRYTSIRGTVVHYNVLNSIVREVTGIQLDNSDLPRSSEWWARKDMMAADVAACRKLFDDLDLEIGTPISAESAWYHPTKRYAGTKDLQATINGVKTLLDLKTSSGLRDKHVLQVAAYCQMENAWHEGAIEQGMLVYLHPKMKRALVKIIKGSELDLAIDEFNEKLSEFWRIPSVMMEYGVQ
jgi:hypothetical protein